MPRIVIADTSPLRYLILIGQAELLPAIYTEVPTQSATINRQWSRESLQLGVFRLGLLKDADVGVGVFPQSEEILVGRLCLGLISRQGVGSAQLQVR